MTTTAPSTASTDSTGVTVGELAGALGMSRSAILRAVESGRFPAPMDERRHGWRVWHPIVALALEVAHALDNHGAAWAEDEAEAVRSLAMVGEGPTRIALSSMDALIVDRLPAALRRRVDVLRAVVPS